MISKLTKFIDQLIKEKRHAKRNYIMYKGLYHGTIPPTHIHVDKQDWLKVINELRELRKRYD